MADRMNHHLDFQFSAPYSTLNELTQETKCVWVVCHGYAQLASYFIKKFEHLPKEHFVVAPQGLSRFYMNDHFRVGASWMTKEDRDTELDNQEAYFGALYQNVFGGAELSNYKIIFFGFSQGVAAMSRVAAWWKIPFDQLILWAGGFPHELTNEDFDFLKPESRLDIVLGNNDPIYKMPVFQADIDRAEKATGLQANFVQFDGKHEIQFNILSELMN